MCVCVLSHFSCVRPFVILRTVACQAPLSMEFSRQELLEWAVISFSRGLLTQGYNPRLFLALAGGFFTTSATWKAQIYVCSSAK